MTAFVDTLREPAWLWLLALLPLLWWWRSRTAPRALLATHGLWQAPLAGPAAALPHSWRERLVWLPFACELLGGALLVVALARPGESVPLPPERLGRSILLCIDRSSSMAAEDLAPGRTRLAVAREVAGAFTAARALDRIGCVEFARYADLRCPPTFDHAALRDLLQEVALVPAESDEDATGIGAAVALAATVLQRAPERGRVLVLLTDGEENVAVSGAPDEIPPEQAGQLCAQFGIRVHTIVVGDGKPGVDGRTVPLDATAVEQIAKATGGRAFAARDAAGLQAAYAEIGALETAVFAEPRWLLREWFPVAIGLALLAWGLGRWLGATWLAVVP